MSDLHFSELATPQILLALNGVCILLLGLFAILWRRECRSVRRLSRQLEGVKQEVRALNSGALGMGRKLCQMAAELAQSPVGTLDTGDNNDEMPYRQAALLLDRGATIEEVVDCCDLPPAEVELLAVMRHSMKTSSASDKKAVH